MPCFHMIFEVGSIKSWRFSDVRENEEVTITWYLPVLLHTVRPWMYYQTSFMFYEHVVISLSTSAFPHFYCLSESETSQPLNTAVNTYHCAHSYEATFQYPPSLNMMRIQSLYLWPSEGSGIKHLTWIVNTKVCYLVKPSHRHQSWFFHYFNLSHVVVFHRC